MATKETKEKVKAALRERKIKLWDPPYTKEDGSSGLDADFISEFSASIGIGKL